jgi:hypothetical protein
MRLTVLQQTAKGLPETTSDGEDTYTLRDDVIRELERLKWFLRHGNVYRALQVVQSVEMDLDAAVANTGYATARKLLKAELCPQSLALSPGVRPLRCLVSLQSAFETGSGLWVVFSLSPEEEAPLQWPQGAAPSQAPA